MGNEQIADVLHSQWKLLWPLSPAERRQRIEETRRDYEYEQLLGAVAYEMAKKDDVVLHQPEPSTLISALSMVFFLGVCAACIIVAATPVPA